MPDVALLLDQQIIVHAQPRRETEGHFAQRIEEGARIADLQINIHGQIEETYHSIPRAIRRAVMSYVDDIFDAVDGWINENGNE